MPTWLFELTRRSCLILGLTGAVSGSLPSGQSPPAVSGRVITRVGERDVPVRHAAVMLACAASPPIVTESDSSGKFRFEDISASGRCHLSAAKAGFIDSGNVVADGETGSASVPVTDVAGTDRFPLRLLLVRAASLQGRLTDTQGDAIQGVSVVALPAATPGGENRRSYQATTDDLGRYRIHTLPAGAYYVYASAIPGEVDLAKTFYPGVLTREASTQVHLAAGQEMIGLEFQMLQRIR